MITTNLTTDIDVERLHPHPDNPRKDLGDLTELAESIKKNGVMQNLTVIPEDENSEGYFGGYYYTVLIGHRRLAAAKLAGLKQVPCRIAMEVSAQEQQLIMLEENMQRNDLTPMEQAEGFQLILDLGGTVQDIEEKTGFSKTTVDRRLKMAKLDKNAVKKAEENFQLSLSDFDELGKIKDVSKRNEILMNVSSSEELKRKVSYALEIARRQKNKDDIIDLLEAAGIKKGPKGIEGEVWGSSKWEIIKNLSTTVQAPDKIVIKEEYEDKAVYAATEYSVYILIPKPKAKSVETPQQAREKEIARRIKGMKEIFSRMTEDRERKIRELITKNECRLKDKESENDAFRICWRTLHEAGSWNSCRIILTFLSRVMWDEDYYSLKPEEKEELDTMEKRIGPNMQMLICASEAVKDNQSSSTALWERFGGKYNPDAGHVHQLMLDALDAFGGFKYDAEEMALINGTHELYMKEETNEG